MKRVLLALLVALPVMASGADREPVGLTVIDRDGGQRARALRLSTDLVDALEAVAEEADELAKDARLNLRRRRLEEVSERADELARDVRRAVVRPLRQGESLRTVARALDRLMPEAAALGESVADIVLLPASLQRGVVRVVQLIRQLQQVL